MSENDPPPEQSKVHLLKINSIAVECLQSNAINLKKKKVILVKEAQSYTEEIRRIISTEYGFEKVYSEGLSISTPLNGKYQVAALEALRSGIESYDRRRGWRGPITNKNINKNWQKKIKSIKIDKTLNWKIAEVTKVENEFSEIRILDNNLSGKIFFSSPFQTIKKNFST